MPIFSVDIEARVTKRIYVDAYDAEEACEAAHEMFTVEPEQGVEERYEQDTKEVRAMPGGFVPPGWYREAA